MSLIRGKTALREGVTQAVLRERVLQTGTENTVQDTHGSYCAPPQRESLSRRGAVMETFSQSAQLLDWLLAGRPVDANMLDEITRVLRREDQFLDYKDGTLLTTRLAGEEVRRYVHGFANALGGVLVLGVSEPPKGEGGFPIADRMVTGCANVGRESPYSWTTNVLRNIAPLVSPVPRITQVDTTTGPVILIATPRSEQLAPSVEGGVWRYAMRFGDGTIDVPDWLVHDLMLGRRRAVKLLVEVADRRGEIETANLANSVRADVVDVGVSLRLENAGFVLAEKVQVGVVSYAVGGEERVSNHLRSFLDIAEPPDHEARWGLRTRNNVPSAYPPNMDEPQPDVPPLEYATVDLVVMRLPRTGAYVARAAVYVMPRGAAPSWYELDVRCEDANITRAELMPCSGHRARVTVDPASRAAP